MAAGFTSTRHRIDGRSTVFCSTETMGSSGIPLSLRTWRNTISNNGGTLAPDSLSIALDLLTQLSASTYYAKIKYLLPLLGSNIIAARVPLIDALGVGIADNIGFVDADFSQSVGLQGGNGKTFNLKVRPVQLGSSNNGGMGAWTTVYSSAGTGTELVASYGSNGANRFVIDVRASGLRFFSWGDANNRAQDTANGAAGHYYGQRSSATDRQFYLGGALLGTNSVNDGGSQSGDSEIRFMSAYAGGYYYYHGTCAVLYLTDGTLTSTEISDLHTLLNSYLITPTGR